MNNANFVFPGFNIDGNKQREEMGGWGPTVFPVVEPVIYREDTKGLEFLVCRRLKGALSAYNPPAFTTSNPGGHHILITDATPTDALTRSLRIKLGLNVQDRHIHAVGTAGPALYRSHMEINGGRWEMVIEEELAEPNTPFLAHVFAVDASGMDIKTNDSLEVRGWFSTNMIFEIFGKLGGNHLYFQFLLAAIQSLKRGYQGEINWQPGCYKV
ncbi:MAG: hypothetical protein UV20_C0018G0009 [Candidatus Magasanikbacteria bacterium GW2011_GWA2_42_32]|uniref:Uncharacterized protein n=1 Tax=Candidatus Magasanikbacteria bacterium GW2011_GWA2_42_32 TaxID=1619039 RepID=A0A0G1CBF8_9BACT|nr:MAG: hypothetical protein UV20_C0018G0009 [Candidatus Magasanikbacteria bacterium GW2011_GWA2_42_32]